MKMLSWALFLLLVGTSVSASAQIANWNILRPQHVDGDQFDYFSISACDDHNYIVPANWLDNTFQLNHPCLVRTTDAGITWMVQDPHIMPIGVQVDKYLTTALLLDSLHVFAIGDSGLIAISSDGGASWIRKDYSTPHPLLSIHFSDSSTGIIAGGAAILITSNGGMNWVPVPNAPYHTLTSCHSFGNGSFRVLNADQGLLYATSDNWKSWDSLHIATPTDTVRGWNGISECKYLGNDTIIATGATYVQSFVRKSRVLESIDGGKTWKELLYRFTHAWPNFISVRNSSFWLGAGWGAGMIYSTDRGANWIDDSIVFSASLGAASVASAEVVSSTKAVGVTDGGQIVSLDLRKLSVAQYARQVNGTHIFPNPASTYVNIQSDIGVVPVVIADVLGRTRYSATSGPDGLLRVDITGWQSGVYQVNILYNGKSIHITNLVVLPQ